MSKHPSDNIKRNLLRRGLAALLSLALMAGLIPGTAVTAYAASAHWAAPYAQKLVDWGIMRGDVSGNLRLSSSITRAEFVTMMNRAYGYTKLGGHPFTDVRSRDWYAEDIDIAYNMGYFHGTSPTTASPTALLSREQATVLLARNMMLQTKPGESLGFSDSRQLSEWSRGLVAAAAESGLVNGLADGTFRPQRNITRGEVAAMLVRAIGNPINTKGDHTLGNVYGNVTVNTAGVTLRDGVIAGNLYLTGGIDLGDVLLENVDVLGEIIVSGGGESNSSQSSITLRNVTADGMSVDSISNQFVTIRAEGNTNIPTTTVRTNAYVDDSSLPGFGLSYIELDGERGTLLQLAGNVKEVLNRTPQSDLQVVQGTAQKITVDEYATDSSVLVDGDARVEDLNLDVATKVTGKGDIDNLNVGSAGSTVEQLPDKIVIRPGIDADINGSEMNSSQAAESSADPRLLAGYPKVKNVSPNSATLVFSVNKPGTIYWAISAVADGSVDEDDLIEPPSYGGNIIKSGTIKATESKTEYTAALSGLIQDGSYYVSAILVDGRENRSPLKVTAFTTPDGTVPAFLSTVKTKETTQVAQITVMPNKSCLLYYALLPAGSKAPTGAELKAGAVSGNLGYGSLDVVKNVNTSINVNRIPLQEKTNYDLFLWLTDHNGAKSMAAPVRVTFNIPDETPPNVTVKQVAPYAPSSAQAEYTMDEDGSVLWAVVTKSAHDNKEFLNYTNEPTASTLTFATPSALMEAKIKVESGKSAGAVASGRASRSPFTISPLNFAQDKTNNYVLYYVGRDTKGNLSTDIKMVEIKTSDSTPPTVEQHFTEPSDTSDDTKDPYASTGIRLEFSEPVKGRSDKNGYNLFQNLYDEVAAAEDGSQLQADKRNALAAALRENIEMWYIPSGKRAEEVTYRDASNEATVGSSWTVDFRYAQVLPGDDGKMVIYLPTVAGTDGNLDQSALNLLSGAQYYFRLKDIYDDATVPNLLNKQRVNQLPTFRTVYAEVLLSGSEEQESANGVELDLCMQVEPLSTSKVSSTERWDLIMWSNITVEMDVYRREKTGNGAWGSWVKLNGRDSTDKSPARITVPVNKDKSGISLYKGVVRSSGFPFLNNSDEEWFMQEGHTYQYGVHFTRVGRLDESQRDSWKELVVMDFSVIAGRFNGLEMVGTNVDANHDNEVSKGTVTPIGTVAGTTGQKVLTLDKQFPVNVEPEFEDGYPTFEQGSSTIRMSLAMKNPGTIYYVVAPAGAIPTRAGNTLVTTDNHDNKTTGQTYIPENGSDRVNPDLMDHIAFLPLKTLEAKYAIPVDEDIYAPSFNNVEIHTEGSPVTVSNAVVNPEVSGLIPSTPDKDQWYYIYFVLESGGKYSKVQCYRVKMDQVERPIVNISPEGDASGTITPDRDAYVAYVAVELNNLPPKFNQQMTGLPSSTDSMTVLEALSRRVNGQQTYFDAYADDALKEYVWTYIETTQYDDINGAPAHRWIPEELYLSTSSRGILANFANYVDQQNYEARYAILACARHRYGNTDPGSYGYAAAQGFGFSDPNPPQFVGNKDHPNIQEVTIREVKDSDGNPVSRWGSDDLQDIYSYKFSGEFTITFDKPLYSVTLENGRYVRREVWAVASGQVDDDEKQVSIMDVIDFPANNVELGTNNKGPSQTFRFKFKDFVLNDYIAFFANSGVANASSSRPGNQQVVLTFDPAVTNKDVLDPSAAVVIYVGGFRVSTRTI